MKNNKKYLVSAIFSLIVALFLGFMTCEHFYRGDITRGVIYLIVTISDLIVFIIYLIKYKKSKCR